MVSSSVRSREGQCESGVVSSQLAVAMQHMDYSVEAEMS